MTDTYETQTRSWLTFLLKSRLLVVAIALIGASITAPNAMGQLPFLDDFEDGNATDGNYRITSSSIASSSADVGVETADGSVLTQLRIVDGATFAGVFGRSGADGFSTYFSLINEIGQFGIGESFADGSIEIKQLIETGLDPVDHDVLIELTFQGQTLLASAWEFGESKPVAAMISVMDDTLATGGLGMLVGDSTTGASATVDYRYFQVVPEPNSWCLLGFGYFDSLH